MLINAKTISKIRIAESWAKQLACRAQSSQLPTDSAASPAAAAAEIPSVLPSDARDQSPLSPAAAAAAAAGKENDHVAGNGILGQQDQEQTSAVVKAESHLADEDEEQPSSATAFVGRDGPAAAVSTSDEVSTPAQPATAGVESPEVVDNMQPDRETSFKEDQQPNAGPMSPKSPFAAADTGHLTVDADDTESPQLKGAAAAVAHARRKSLGEELPEQSGAPNHISTL